MESEEFNALQAKALEQLRNGQSLTGKGGVFTPLLKGFIETALNEGVEQVVFYRYISIEYAMLKTILYEKTVSTLRILQTINVKVQFFRLLPN